MTMRLLASCGPGEVRVLAMAEEEAIDAAIWRPGAPDGVGDLHRGRLVARLPALAGAFVALDGAEGFLPDSAGGAGLAEGSAIGVRIVRAGQGGKGPRLTAAIDERDRARIGAGPPALIERGPHALTRIAALHPDAEVTVDDPALAAALREELGARTTIAGTAFDDAAEAAFEALTSPRATLPGGAEMHVHPTPALTAIDIDLAAASGERGGKAAAHHGANLKLLPALARQIRARNLGGAIVVDLAGLSPKRRAALGPAFAAALENDVLRPRFLGFTALGFAEILRPRIHPPLHEVLAGPHAAGLEALRVLLAESQARPAAMLRLRAAPAIATALAADSHARADLARRTGRPLIMETDRNMPAMVWRIEET
jgi:Ribonuclease G/E